MVNDLIRFLAERELSQTVYNAFLGLSFAGWLLYNLRSGREYGIPPGKRLIISAVVWPVAYGLLYVLYWVESRFTAWGSHNIVRGYIWFPFIALALAKLLHLRGRTVVDYIAPGCSLSQGVAHIGCSFAGCCYGFPAEKGIWNPQFDAILFPNQILEAIAALLVFAVCALYAKKRKYDSSGRVYPLFLILFGVTRFFLEFLRDNQKVIGKVSLLALHCVLMVLVGAVWLAVRRIQDRKTQGGKAK